MRLLDEPLGSTKLQTLGQHHEWPVLLVHSGHEVHQCALFCAFWLVVLEARKAGMRRKAGWSAKCCSGGGDRDYCELKSTVE